jgi:serine/threonine protein kinase
LYQIVREKVLGSGQFGTVFHGIHRQTSREVAVKVCFLYLFQTNNPTKFSGNRQRPFLQEAYSIRSRDSQE